MTRNMRATEGKKLMTALTSEDVAGTVIAQGEHLKALTHRVNDLDEKFDEKMNAVGAKLDTLTASVQSYALRPTLRIADVLTTVKDGAVLVALMVGAIVWVAKANYDAQLSIVNERQQASSEDRKIIHAELAKIESDRWGRELQSDWCNRNKVAYPNLVCN